MQFELMGCLIFVWVLKLYVSRNNNLQLSPENVYQDFISKYDEGIVIKSNIIGQQQCCKKLSGVWNFSIYVFIFIVTFIFHLWVSSYLNFSLLWLIYNVMWLVVKEIYFLWCVKQSDLNLYMITIGIADVNFWI